MDEDAWTGERPFWGMPIESDYEKTPNLHKLVGRQTDTILELTSLNEDLRKALDQAHQDSAEAEKRTIKEREYRDQLERDNESVRKTLKEWFKTNHELQKENTDFLTQLERSENENTAMKNAYEYELSVAREKIDLLGAEADELKEYVDSLSPVSMAAIRFIMNSSDDALDLYSDLCKEVNKCLGDR